MNCPSPTIRNEIRNITVPITLICSGVPLDAAPQTNIGNVIELEDALKLVMM